MAQLMCKGMKRGAVVAIPILFLMVGCGSSQQELKAKDQLERARTVYSQAKTDRDVQTYASGPLTDAGKALGDAEQAWCANKKEHLGYLAEKKSRIALAAAEGEVAQREIARLQRETAELMAEQCTQELRLSKKEAEEARREVEQAKSLALAEAAKAEGIRAEADQLRKELADLKTRKSKCGILFRMPDALFDTGKSNLLPEAVRAVDTLVEFLEKHANRNVLIEGHTDSTGGDELNLTLSQKRADAVKERLMAKGVAEKKITTKAYGKKYPLASNETPAGRQRNRRVEVIVLNEGVKPETQFRE